MGGGGGGGMDGREFGGEEAGWRVGKLEGRKGKGKEGLRGGACGGKRIRNRTEDGRVLQEFEKGRGSGDAEFEWVG